MANRDTSLPAILLIGHGSRLASGIAEFQRLAEQLQRALPKRTCVAGFLELATPSLAEALEQLYQQGFRQITAIPALLLAAGHVKRDIPNILSAFQANHPQLTITFGAELGLHANLLEIARERIESAELDFGATYQRQETLLLVIGRGSSDPEANAKLCQIANQLGETLGFGTVETAYTAVARPSMIDALAQESLLGFKQVLVLPYLLFAGQLVAQIRATVAAQQCTHSDRKIVLAPHINHHPLLVQIILERLEQAEASIASTSAFSP